MKVVLAFAAIYIIWGSTYLSMAIAIESIPPFMMAGVRFTIAGLILIGWTFALRKPMPTWKEWKATIVSGSFLIIGGNMSVVWAEQFVPSAVAAIIIASVPIWLVLMDGHQRKQLFKNMFLLPGLLIGFGGVFYLMGNGEDVPIENEYYVYMGRIVLICAAVFWSAGTYLSRSPKHPSNSLLKSGMQMFSGGVITLILSVLLGEFNDVGSLHFTTESVLALGYLIVFGALIGYSSYVWLVQVRPPTQVSTYAYVNPVVAVLLGWGFHNEPITKHTIIALCIILLGVFLINQSFRKAKKAV